MGLLLTTHYSLLTTHYSLLTMRIGINVSFLRKPETGIGQVTMHFLRTLIEAYRMNRIFAEHTFVLYGEEDIDWELPENFEKRIVLPFWKRDDLVRKWLWEGRVLPREAERDGCDVFLSLYQSATIFSSRSRVRHSMLVHDIIPKLFPEYLGTLRKRFYWRAIERGIVGANTLLAVSHRTEKDIAQHLGIDAKKIFVAPIDTDPIFSRPVSPKENDRVMKKYKLDSGYLYCGGGLEARKNIEGLLLAYRMLLRSRDRFSDQKTVVPDLVISGALYPHLAPLVTDVPKKVAEMNLGNYVRVLGRVDQKDLPALYKNARLFVYPSRYEGFGLPPLEAMRIGVPVVASKRSSLPEVLGDAAIYFDPDRPEDMAQTILTALRQKDLREEMIRRGQARAKQYSWKTFMEKTISVVIR